MNPFRILGIADNSTIEEAKKAYRRLAHVHHPDKGGSAAKFMEIKRAWETIERGYRHSAGAPPSQNGDPFEEGMRRGRHGAKRGTGSRMTEDQYQDIINDLMRKKSDLDRQRDELMRKQTVETHEEWKRRMNDAINRSR